MATIKSLPEELLVEIAKNLLPVDVFNLSLTNHGIRHKCWHAIAFKSMVESMQPEWPAVPTVVEGVLSQIGLHTERWAYYAHVVHGVKNLPTILQAEGLMDKTLMWMYRARHLIIAKHPIFTNPAVQSAILKSALGIYMVEHQKGAEFVGLQKLHHSRASMFFYVGTLLNATIACDVPSEYADSLAEIGQDLEFLELHARIYSFDFNHILFGCLARFLLIFSCGPKVFEKLEEEGPANPSRPSLDLLPLFMLRQTSIAPLVPLGLESRDGITGTGASSILTNWLDAHACEISNSENLRSGEWWAWIGIEASHYFIRRTSGIHFTVGTEQQPRGKRRVTSAGGVEELVGHVRYEGWIDSSGVMKLIQTAERSEDEYACKLFATPFGFFGYWTGSGERPLGIMWLWKREWSHEDHES